MYAVIGANVPDYRGIFLRGHGSRISTHFGTVVHSSENLGVIQGDATRPIRVIFYARGTDAISAGAAWFGSQIVAERKIFANGMTAKLPKVNSSETMVEEDHIDTGKLVPSASEIRPVNMAVKYLILASD